MLYIWNSCLASRHKPSEKNLTTRSLLKGPFWSSNIQHLSPKDRHSEDEFAPFVSRRLRDFARRLWYLALWLWWCSVAGRSGYRWCGPSARHPAQTRWDPRQNFRHDFLGSYHGQGKKLVFVTNNATKSRKSYKKKFDQLGLNVHVVRIQSMLCVSLNI